MPRIVKYAIVWTILCWIAAAPSFYFALLAGKRAEFDVAAMVIGVFIFVAIYTIVSVSSFATKLRQHTFWRRAILFGYGLRMILSISMLLPFSAMIGGAIDFFSGLVSMNIVQFSYSFLDLEYRQVITGLPEQNTGNSYSFWATFFTTMVQGVLLNIVILISVLLAVWAQGAYQKLRK